MKNLLMGLALLLAVSTAASAHDKKGKKAKAKTTTEQCEKKCDKTAGGHPCCAKKTQA
jgi:hypothetical protein